VELRRAGLRGLLGIDDDFQRFVIDFDQVERVFGGVAIFGDDDGDAVIVINLAEDGTTIFYGNGSETVVGVGSGADKTCDVVIEKQDEDGATGSFDCEDTPGTASSGATFASGISMKGRFEARSH